MFVLGHRERAGGGGQGRWEAGGKNHRETVQRSCHLKGAGLMNAISVGLNLAVVDKASTAKITHKEGWPSWMPVKETQHDLGL